MHPLVELAKRAVHEYVTKKTVLSLPENPSPEMEERAGVFVCLKAHGELRGCVGTFMPCHKNVAEEVIRNAIAAATEDHRFFPVQADELKDIVFTVDVLSPPEKVAGQEELDSRRYGVIVVSGGRKGLLLPDLEGVDTVEEQIRIAKMKAGISTHEHAEIYRFEVRRYH